MFDGVGRVVHPAHDRPAPGLSARLALEALARMGDPFPADGAKASAARVFFLRPSLLAFLASQLCKALCGAGLCRLFSKKDRTAPKNTSFFAAIVCNPIDSSSARSSASWSATV